MIAEIKWKYYTEQIMHQRANCLAGETLCQAALLQKQVILLARLGNMYEASLASHSSTAIILFSNSVQSRCIYAVQNNL